MFQDENRTYPGRKFVQALQVGLVIAIGAVILVALNRPHDEPIDDFPTAPLSATIEAVEVVPTASVTDRALALYDSAWTAHDRDNYDEAIDLYTQVLELDSTMDSAWLGRAVAYAQTGEDVRSRKDFLRYVETMETDRVERDITANDSFKLDMTEGRVYALSLKVEAGDRLSITAKSVETADPDVVDPLVVILDSQNTLIEADDDTLRSDGSLINMNSQIKNYDVTHDGTYTILVTHAGGGSEGLVDVTVTVR